jgi:hypothetical protein
MLGLGWKSRVAPKLDYLLYAIHTVDGQNGKNAEVDNQDGPVKSIDIIKRTDVIYGSLTNGIGIPGFVQGITIAGDVRTYIPGYLRRAKPALLQTLSWIN